MQPETGRDLTEKLKALGVQLTQCCAGLTTMTTTVDAVGVGVTKEEITIPGLPAALAEWDQAAKRLDRLFHPEIFQDVFYDARLLIPVSASINAGLRVFAMHHYPCAPKHKGQYVDCESIGEAYQMLYALMLDEIRVAHEQVPYLPCCGTAFLGPGRTPCLPCSS